MLFKQLVIEEQKISCRLLWTVRLISTRVREATVLHICMIGKALTALATAFEIYGIYTSIRAIDWMVNVSQLTTVMV